MIGALALVETANAIPPAFTSLSHQARHPRATISTPRAAHVSLEIATKPDRATDGSFLRENVTEFEVFTDSEIQTGSWLHERALDPGTYYLMMEASPESSCTSFPPPNYTRVVDPSCADGYSEVATLSIPKPASRYSVTIRRYSGLRQFSLSLRARPLGENRHYRLCYRLKTKRRVCLRGTLIRESRASESRVQGVG
jgi:hypothetical protein